MKLILNQPVNYQFYADTITEFEKAIISYTKTQSVLPLNRKLSKLAFYNWRVLKRCGIPYTPLSLFNFFPLRNHDKIQHYFTILMGIDFLNCLPYFMLPVRKSIYMFDAWPVSHEIISQFVSHFGVEHIFLSSSQATDRLKNTAGRSQFHWIPEGINPEEYKHFSYQRKDIDVLAFGRQYDEYHEKIKSPLETDGKVYIYAKTQGKIALPLFLSRETFIEGLARSKVSICVPSGITNPQRSGDIQTMTIRYLQSMVSKCLIVGHAPDEMITLFGYNPVIEIDMENAVSQIREILSNYSAYRPLIERNYTSVIEGHTWSHRWKMITEILNK